MKWRQGHSVVSDILRPHGLFSPWDSPGQNPGVGSLSLLQGLFPTQGSNPGLLHCRRILYQLSHRRSPCKPKHFKIRPTCIKCWQDKLGHQISFHCPLLEIGFKSECHSFKQWSELAPGGRDLQQKWPRVSLFLGLHILFTLLQR